MIRYSLIGYIFVCSVVLLISWLVYRLFISKDLQPSKNRKLVLGIYLLMVIAPFVSGSALSSSQPDSEKSVILREITIDFSGGNGVTDSGGLYFSHLQDILLIIYLAGVIVVTVLTLFNLVQLWRIYLRSKKMVIEGKVVYVHESKLYGPYTCFAKIFLRKDFLDLPLKEQRMILLHEQAHVSHRHYWDIIISQLGVIFQWFNPVAWLLQNELKALHEYEADKAVIDSGMNTKDYQNMLIDNGAIASFIGMAVLFNNGSLRKRILMMRRRNFKEGVLKRWILITGLAFLTGFIVNIPAVASIVGTKDFLKMRKNYALGINSSEYSGRFRNYNSINGIQKIHHAVEVMPIYGGDPSTERIKSDLESLIYYPEKAIKNGIEGKVFIRFIVSDDGSVKDLSVIRSVDPELDKIAVEAVKSLPDSWQPATLEGRPVSCWFILPVNFKLPSKS